MMIDKLVLQIPFKDEFVILDDSKERAVLDVNRIIYSGVNLASRSISVINGHYHLEDLHHPFESLPSSYESMAMKIYHQPVNQFPHVAIKCSPAKLMQGHNVYGSNDPLLCGGEMMALLAASYPVLADMLDFHLAELSEIDTTFSVRAASQEHCDQFILACGNVSKGQTKKREGYATTAYFGAKNSRLKRNKIYAKYHEVIETIKRLKRENQYSLVKVGKDSKNSNGNKITGEKLRVGSNDHLIKINESILEYSRGLIRFEPNIHKRYLQRRGIPTGFLSFCKYAQDFESENGYSLTQHLFQLTFKEIFAAFEGVNMNVYQDDKLLDQLKVDHVKFSKKTGKPSYNTALSLFRTYRAIRSDGWEAVQKSMVSSTFYLHVSLLQKSGVSRAWLQNMNSARQNNVVPMVNLIKVDFSNQHPADYQEPVSQFDERFKDPRKSKLRLVA